MTQDYITHTCSVTTFTHQHDIYATCSTLNWYVKEQQNINCSSHAILFQNPLHMNLSQYVNAMDYFTHLQYSLADYAYCLTMPYSF